MSPRFIRYAAVFLISLLLQACGGGGGSATTGSGASVSGVAATGLAINGSVTLKDATGASRTATVSQPSGAFNIDVTGLTPPYFLKAADTTGATTLYSIATGSGNFNINPLTNLAVVAAAMNIDPLAKTPDAAFNNPANFAGLTPAQIQTATSSVMAQMSPAFQAALSANGAGNVNPLTDSFQVGKGLDKVFDGFVVTLNASTGEVQERQVANNTTTVLGLVDKLGTFPAAGIYDGSVVATTIYGSINIVASKEIVITPSGEMRYVMDNGVQVIATLTASGSTVTGSGKAYAPTLNGQPTNFQFADGSTTLNLTIKGTLGTGTFSGTYTYGNYSDTFSFTLNTQQTSNPSSLNKIAGTYASSSDSNTVFIGHIEANGKIWGSGPGIAYSGLIQVVDPNTNIYRVTLSYLNQDGTASFVSGLATFYDISPTTDSLSEPATLVPGGYTGEITSLTYNQTVTGSHAKLLMQLSSPLKQIFVSAIRMTTQLQPIALQTTANSLMIQTVGISAFSVAAPGDIQYSGSGGAFGSSGSTISSGGAIYVIGNIGDIALNGTEVVSIPSSPTVNPTTLQSGQLTNGQQNSILTGSLIGSTDSLVLAGTGGNLTGSVGTICGQTSANTGNTTTPQAGTLIITANPACKTYDGMTYSGGNGVTYSGFLNGDTPAVLGGTLVYGGTSQGARNAGTYTITPGGLTSSDYNIIYVGNTLTINPVSLTFTLTGSTEPKIYEGGVAGSSLDVLSGSVTFISGESLGSLIISGTNAGNYSSSGTNAGNYSLSGGTLTLTGSTVPTISPIALTSSTTTPTVGLTSGAAATP